MGETWRGVSDDPASLRLTAAGRSGDEKGNLELPPLLRQTDHLFFEGTVPVASRHRLREIPRSSRPAIVAETGEPHAFLVWLFDRAGLCVRHYRGRSLSRRLAACLRQLRVRTAEEARRLLEERPELLPRAIDAVLLGVTQFFRDAAVFQCLRDVVLSGAAGGPAPLRVWSAACSEGHELYSVAMLLDQLGRLSGAHLLGTDFRRSAVEQARAGLFPVESLRLIEPVLRARCFVERGREAHVHDRLRGATCWATQNLFDGAAPGPWDVILWRNMAIYLAPEAADRLWRSLWRELRPGGHLVAGKADHLPRDLGWRRIAPCVYRKTEAAS